MNLHVAPAAALAARPPHSCVQCSKPLLPTARRHARYCGATCRKRASRQTAVNARESVTAANPVHPAREPVSRFLGHLLARLDGEQPAYIESTHTGRVYPRTYAEHGLPFPDHLRLSCREFSSVRFRPIADIRLCRRRSPRCRSGVWGYEERHLPVSLGFMALNKGISRGRRSCCSQCQSIVSACGLEHRYLHVPAVLPVPEVSQRRCRPLVVPSDFDRDGCGHLLLRIRLILLLRRLARRPDR